MKGDVTPLQGLWRQAGLPQPALGFAKLTGVEPVLPSSFAVATAAQAGLWAERRGFDSLAQSAMGFNDAEGKAAGQDSPRPLPMQILDHATGYLIAMGVSAAGRLDLSFHATRQFLAAVVRRSSLSARSDARPVCPATIA